LSKIGIDARMLGPKQTGIGNYIKNLLCHILHLDQRNQYFLFLLPEECLKVNQPQNKNSFSRFYDQLNSASNIQLIKTTAKWYTFAEQTKFLLQLLKYDLDLVHFPHFNVPILYPKKFIVTIHDLTQNYFPGRSASSKIRHWAYKKIFQTAIKKSKKIIAVSNYTKNDILKCFVFMNRNSCYQALLEKKIQVIYEGLDEIFFKQHTEKEIKQFQKRYNLSNPYILYIGVWRKHKNLAGLLYAFKSLREKYQLNYDLCLVGEEHSSYPVKKIIESLGIKDYIKCPGFLKQKELPLIYKGSSLYCLPSLREGFGFTPLEAMACGTPVVSTNTTSLPEVLGEAAEYFNPNNTDEITEKMAKVLINKSLANELINKGYQQARKYKWENCAKKTLEIYQQVLLN